MNAAAEEDVRNDWGLPPVSVTAHEKANQTTNVDQSVNKALPYVAFSWFLSGGAIIGLILMALMLPELIEAKVEKAAAQIRASAGKEVADAKVEMARQLAEAQAYMRLSETNALLAKDRTDKIAASLEARGFIKLENH